MTISGRCSTPEESGGPGRPARRWPAKRGGRKAATDYPAIRELIDLADVARGLLGAPPGRRGTRGGKRLWWPCPFHQDANPSFCVEPGRAWWKCFGCGEYGDALELVMRLRGMTFGEALTYVGRNQPGRAGLEQGSRSPHRSPQRRLSEDTGKPQLPPARDVCAPIEPDPVAAGMRALVEEAETRLWRPEGRQAREYLRHRGLEETTIRAARLGWTERASMSGGDGAASSGRGFGGITIPWFGPEGLELVKVRPFDPGRPRYVEVYRRRPTVYPGMAPEEMSGCGAVVLVEGEIDALVLGQALDGLATVFTLGSASMRPTPEVLEALISVTWLFLATDADEAGDRAAAGWPGRALRVRPPAPHKDWGDAHMAGMDLRAWWGPWLKHYLAEPTARRVSGAGRDRTSGSPA